MRQDVDLADDMQGELLVDVTDATSVNKLIEDNSVDFLGYIGWDEVSCDLGSCTGALTNSMQLADDIAHDICFKTVDS